MTKDMNNKTKRQTDKKVEKICLFLNLIPIVEYPST